ncbi:protein NRT1/ PTR FAMILY 5.10-like isoform X2 [Humulus lupulus]|uniref:protein NRT1/ PTR FAMILY 5.10-like isoform X2 n=1 Tax=Humulus lupulus TaxID=3486 RepID=UPI002B40B87F|nr:protein NRT1/ PTR FAMILY 5.10-like isoform X2 [Humulus lupulus]
MADEVETPMLLNPVDGAVDYKGRPFFRFRCGGWRSASLIIGVEVAERFAYYGVSSNLVTYLTGPLGESTATAAANVNAWAGTAALLPLLGGFIADSFLGRYRTVIVASLLYILGLGLLSMSATLPSVSGFGCQNNNNMLCSTPQFRVIVSVLIVSYIQDNLSWALGFGLPCIAMVIGLVVFLLGTTTYRYSIELNKRGPFVRIGSVFVAAFRNRRRTLGLLPDRDSDQFRFLNRALLAPTHLQEDDCVCSRADIEEAKAVLRLVPIWLTCLTYGIVFAQSSTLFTKQGATMDRTIVSGSSSKISAASLQCFIYLTVLIFLPIYDRIFVPVARTFTRAPSGITMLQRIGVGFLFHALSMVVAALVELKRLKTAQEYDLVDMPSAMIPMSVWWLLPQYLLFGIADVFSLVGMQEFFYDQVPTELRSIGLALYFSVFGIGSFLSSFLISVIEKATADGEGRNSWFSNNLNRAHLDYFYWLLFGLSTVGFAAYLHFANSYIYNTRGKR